MLFTKVLFTRQQENTIYILENRGACLTSPTGQKIAFIYGALIGYVRVARRK